VTTERDNYYCGVVVKFPVGLHFVSFLYNYQLVSNKYTMECGEESSHHVVIDVVIFSRQIRTEKDPSIVKTLISIIVVCYESYKQKFPTPSMF
jgi:hypothetical protein